jgi:hypothetical protein
LVGDEGSGWFLRVKKEERAKMIDKAITFE